MEPISPSFNIGTNDNNLSIREKIVQWCFPTGFDSSEADKTLIEKTLTNLSKEQQVIEIINELENDPSLQILWKSIFQTQTLGYPSLENIQKAYSDSKDILERQGKIISATTALWEEEITALTIQLNTNEETINKKIKELANTGTVEDQMKRKGLERALDFDKYILENKRFRLDAFTQEVLPENEKETDPFVPSLAQTESNNNNSTTTTTTPSGKEEDNDNTDISSEETPSQVLVDEPFRFLPSQYDSTEKDFASTLRKVTNANRLDLSEIATTLTNADLESLVSLGTIEELDLGTYPLDNTGLSTLLRYRNLRRLTLRNFASFDEESWTLLTTIYRLEKLILDFSKGLGAFSDETLENFSFFSSLTELRLINHSQLTSSCFAHIAQLTTLQTLGLENCPNLTSGSFKNLFHTLTQLEHLNLQGFPKLGDTDCEDLSQVKTLRFLNLHGNHEITDEGVSSLAALTNLEELTLTNPSDPPLGTTRKEREKRIQGEGLEKLSSLKKLKRLSLPEKHFNRIEKNHFFIIHVCNELCQNIDSLHIDMGDLHFFSGISIRHCTEQGAYKTKVLEVALSPSAVQRLGIETILETYPDLEVLNLYFIKELVSDETLASIAKLKNLKTLHLSGCTATTNEGLLQLTSLPIQELFLDGCTNIDRKALCQFQKLLVLSLIGCTQINDEDLTAITENTSVTSFDLEGCKNITDEGILAVCQNSRLQKVNLMGCVQITDKGMEEFKKCKILRELNLSGCTGISEEGFCYLADCSCLTTLYLSGTNVTDSSLQAISQCTGLQTLLLDYCEKLTLTGLAFLANLPNCKMIDISNCAKISNATAALFALEKSGCEIKGFSLDFGKQK